MTNSSKQIKKVLLVDDAEPIRLIAKIGLEDRPHWQVILAASGQETLEIAKKEKPDLILLDVMMPGMDGKETLIKLREDSLTAQIPVIFITANAQKHELASYIGLGVLGVIVKPFDPLKLSTEIERILDGKQ